MENSYEAIYTGVYLFVFVAAMTIAVYLFQGINDLANTSYDYGKAVTDNAIIETSDEDTKYLSKEDIISYYFNYIKKDNYEDAPTGLPELEITYNGYTLSSSSENNNDYMWLKTHLPSSKKYLLTLDRWDGNTPVFKITTID